MSTDTTAPRRAAGCPDGAPRPSRRGLLLGLSAAAVLGGARVAFARGAPGGGDARLVVVILRGGMDGLSAVQPYGDPAFAGLRGPLALPEPGREGGTLDLGGRYGLHPRLAGLHALYRANEMLVLHAVAGPHRVRSHFEAQDLLETGEAAQQRLRSGWLNRALSGLPGGGGGVGGAGRGGEDAAGLAVGLEVPLLLRGAAPVRNIAPRGVLDANEDVLARIAALMQRDPKLGPAIRRGMAERGLALGSGMEGAAAGRGGGGGGGGLAGLAALAGRVLAQPDGPRVAALEMTGWDTHIGQAPKLGHAMATLDAGIAALREALGEAAWRRSAVLMVTEFGRTARVNGNQGTDHGTAGAAFLAGGAVAGGRVQADWPGLGPGRLFEDRDLAPTLDLRAVAKGLLRDHLRLPAPAVEAAFPDSAAVAPVGGLVRATAAG
jgi:uncharacterized protein (DUF1501 family)